MEKKQLNTVFIGVLAFIQFVAILLMAFVIKNPDWVRNPYGSVYDVQRLQTEADNDFNNYLNFHFLTFVGFGFLLLFLRNYQVSIVSYLILMGAITVQLYPGVDTLMGNLWGNDGYNDWETYFSFKMIIQSDIVMIGFIIAFGAFAGRINPATMAISNFIFVIMYCIVKHALIKFEIMDQGGLLQIHLFGAVFGIVTSMILAANQKDLNQHENTSLIKPTELSNTQAMIGTLFLFVYFPILAAYNGLAVFQTRIVINILLALIASGVATFVMSIILTTEDQEQNEGSNGVYRTQHKFNMIHIQNATLAGGIVTSSPINPMFTAFEAILIGFIAGVLVTVIMHLIRKMNIKDTRLTIGTHLVPALLGVFLTAAYLVIVDEKNDVKQEQIEAGTSLYGLIIIVGALIAAIGGAIGGAISGGIGFVLHQKNMIYYEDNEYFAMNKSDE